MSLNCKEKKCIELYSQEMEDVSDSDDMDFHFFHCSVEGCHDISMGKTSFHCVECGKWICQGCAEKKSIEVDDDFYCLSCYESRL